MIMRIAKLCSLALLSVAGLPALSALFQFIQRHLRLSGCGDNSAVVVLSHRGRDSAGW